MTRLTYRIVVSEQSKVGGTLIQGFSPSESLTALAKYLVVKLSFKDQDTRLLETLFN